MTQQTYCVYHSADFDGICSAAIVLRYNPETILVPWDYGDDLDIEQFKGHKVIMADVSLPWPKMGELIQLLGAGNFIWIDHHITAIKDYSDKYYIIHVPS